MINNTLYYIHDPMCSWCWAFSHAFDKLLEQLPKEIKVKRLLGGLAADSEQPMTESMKKEIQSNWFRIEETIEGIKFNFDFWTNTEPRRSTYPACRAVIAARLQGPKNDIIMTKAIQTAYYQQARNPSDPITLMELAFEIGLDREKFQLDYAAFETKETLKKEIMLCRSMFVESFPSLVLVNSEGVHDIELNYLSPQAMLAKIIECIR